MNAHCAAGPWDLVIAMLMGQEQTWTCSLETITTSPTLSSISLCIQFCRACRIGIYSFDHHLQKILVKQLVSFHLGKYISQRLTNSPKLLLDFNAKSSLRLKAEWAKSPEDMGTNGQVSYILSTWVNNLLGVSPLSVC